MKCWKLSLTKYAISGQLEHSLALHARLHHLAQGGKGWEHPVFPVKYLTNKSQTLPDISEAFNPSDSLVLVRCWLRAVWRESEIRRRILIRTGERSLVYFVLFIPEAWMSKVWLATEVPPEICKLWTKSTAKSENPTAQKEEKQWWRLYCYWQNVWKCCIEQIWWMKTRRYKSEM